MSRFRWTLLLFSGFALSFAFAPYPTRFLAFLALIPLLWTVKEERRPFVKGYIFGLGLGAGQLWWLISQTYPLRPGIWVLMIVGICLLVGYVALFPALFATITKRVGLWAAPLIWPTVEMLRELTDLAFPWEFLGYSLTPWPIFTQTASIWGVYGLSALIVLINLAIYKLIRNFRDKKESLKWGLILVCTFTFIVGFGGARLGFSKKTDELKAALIQPNVPTILKGSREVYDSLVTGMLDQTRKAAAHNPDLILYPETSTLTDLARTNKYTDAYLATADSINIPIATGIPHWVHDGKRWRFANAATVIRPDGSLAEIYVKIRLAPFGETIPFENVLPFLAKIDVQGGHHYRGKEYRVFELEPANLSFLICYESIFPLLTRNFVNKGSRLLCNVTNDVWFGRLQGPSQHAEMAVLRAVENGVPLIRAANNGISMLVDPYGRVLARTELLTKTILVGEVPRAVGPTFYTRVGFLFPYVAAAVVVAMLVVRLIQRRKRSKQVTTKKKI